MIFSGLKYFAILAVANFANINSNECFCPVGIRCIVNTFSRTLKGRYLADEEADFINGHILCYFA